ncbi:MAG: FliO/MopB family protein [OCS116 cluster bacterium]|nr:FliO/MopB family protein [OCS116 cluster bacterium]
MDLISYTKYFGALAAIVILILAIAYILKRVTKNKARVSAQHDDIFNSKSSSLFIQEVLPIDQKTKVVIIGRDNLRHVILLGETHSQLIETVEPAARNTAQKSDELTAAKDELTAAKQVGSITTPASGALKIDKTPQPDISGVKAEPVNDEPSLAVPTKKPTPKPVEEKSANIKKQDTKTQIEDDLQSDLEFKDKRPSNSDLKDIKDKLQDAKALAEPEK